MLLQLAHAPSYPASGQTSLQDNELQLGDIVGVHPVLGSLSDEVLLAATGRGVALGGISPGPDQIIKPRQLDNKRIVIVLKERLCIEPCRKDRP